MAPTKQTTKSKTMLANATATAFAEWKPDRESGAGIFRTSGDIATKNEKGGVRYRTILI